MARSDRGDRSAKLRLPHAPERSFYMATELRDTDIKTLAREYTQYRDLAQKRLKRLKASAPESEAYKSHAEGFPKIADLKKSGKLYKGALIRALVDVTRFVNAESTTLTGQKDIAQRKIDTLRGYNLIQEGASEDDLKKLYKFVDFVRDVLGDNMIQYKIARDSMTGAITDQRLKEAINKGQYARAYYYTTGKKVYDEYRAQHKGDREAQKAYSERVRRALQ